MRMVLLTGDGGDDGDIDQESALPGVTAVRRRVLLQFTKQRAAKPDFGLREAILLPWYGELARQYIARPYGTPWQGNASLLAAYELAAFDAGETRFNRAVDLGRLWTFRQKNAKSPIVDL